MIIIWNLVQSSYLFFLLTRTVLVDCSCIFHSIKSRFSVDRNIDSWVHCMICYWWTRKIVLMYLKYFAFASKLASFHFDHFFINTVIYIYTQISHRLHAILSLLSRIRKYVIVKNDFAFIPGCLSKNSISTPRWR